MSIKPWLSSSGKVLVSETGKVLVCEDCPCEDVLLCCNGIAIPTLLHCVITGDLSATFDLNFFDNLCDGFDAGGGNCACEDAVPVGPGWIANDVFAARTWVALLPCASSGCSGGVWGFRIAFFCTVGGGDTCQVPSPNIARFVTTPCPGTCDPFHLSGLFSFTLSCNTFIGGGSTINVDITD